MATPIVSESNTGLNLSGGGSLGYNSTGAYWIGADGQAYIKAAGQPNVVVAPAGEIQYFSNLAQIPDPNAPVSAAPSNPTGATRPVLNQGAVNNTQGSINQIPALLAAALAAEDQTYQNNVADENTQEGVQRDTYGKSTTTNQQNYDQTFMDSIRAGIHGLGGLMALLRGTGAAGGTAEDQARDTVGGVTANDIRGGADTQKGNQSALDSSLSTFLTDLGTKRRQNEDTHVNNARAIQRDSNTQLQDLYSKLAGYYGDAGMTSQANDFMARAGGLTPTIAANSTTQVSPYDTTPVAVAAPQLTAFAAPTQPNVLAAPSDGQVGSGIFTISNKKRDTSPSAVPALAGA